MTYINPKLNTNYVGHHVSSGGFVFYKDKKNGGLYAALLKDRHGNWWIPRGHIEGGESQVDAAIREIEEELGIARENISYIDFCYKESYSYQENGGTNTKDVFIYIFSVPERYPLAVDVSDHNLVSAAWFSFDEAVDIIAFNKQELVTAKSQYEKSVG